MTVPPAWYADLVEANAERRNIQTALAHIDRLVSDLQQQWVAAHYDHCGPTVDARCPKEGRERPHGCWWPMPESLAVFDRAAS